MASERFFRPVSQAFTLDGTNKGVVKVVSTSGFKVKAKVLVKSNTRPNLTLEIKRIPDEETLEIGPEGSDMDSRADLSLYLVLDGATVIQGRQKRPSIGPGEIDRSTYEEEPTVARRVIPVDEMGNLITRSNPLPVDAIVTVDAVKVRDEDGDELAVNPDGSINVNFNAQNASNPVIMNVSAPSSTLEYSFQIPAIAKRFLVKTRTSSSLKLSFQVGGTTVNYISLSAGSVYNEDGVVLQSPLNVFVKAGKSNETIEVLYWT